jgi:hypothetical protein
VDDFGKSLEARSLETESRDQHSKVQRLPTWLKRAFGMSKPISPTPGASR